MKKLYIIGAGGFGREVAWLVRRINEQNPTYDICGFLDDDESKIGNCENGYTVLGNCGYLNSIKEDVYVACAVANVNYREKIIKSICEYNNSNIRFPILIDPNAVVSDNAEIGEGTIICAGCIVSVDTKIGKYNIFDWNSTIGHDVVTSDYITLYPSVNVSGAVNIGTMVEIGTGSQIIQGLEISESVVIGAGSVIVKNISCTGTYAGVPAKKIK